MEIHLRFGMHKDIPLIHAEQAHLDGLVIPGHILAYQAASTSVFVTSLHGKPHVIDPMTFLFQNPKSALENERGEIRPSIQKLCACYHDDLADALKGLDSYDVLAPSAYPDLDAFCDNVIAFQLEHVGERSATSAAKKYLKRYNRTSVTEPRALLPAYWRFGSVTDRFYAMTLRAAQRAAHKTIPIAPVICCPADALDGDGVSQVVADYGKFPSVFIWLDGLSQMQATVEEVLLLRQLVAKLKGAGVEIETLYGGYMMMLAEHDGMRGISHGVLYTEHKSITVTPGGSGGTDRFYIQRLHGFRSLSQTDLIVHKHPELLGTTRVCREVLKGNPDNIILLADEPELMREHFLEARKLEAAHVRDSTPKSLLDELRTTQAKYHESLRELPNPDAYMSHAKMRGLTYLVRWADGFEAPLS